MFTKINFQLFTAMLLISSCTSDVSIDGQGDYQQQYRPQLHYSPASNWMGVPSSSVFFEDEYHLFYQNSKDSNEDNSQQWGHAISEDLIHWKTLGIALQADEKETIHPGSIAIDWWKSGEFSIEDEPPMVAAYTKNQSLAFAFSTDKGRKWTKYAESPIVNNFSDHPLKNPKILWDADSEQWIMLLAAEKQVLFYGSQNFKKWNYLSAFGQNLGAQGGEWFYPDFFPTTISETGARKWILLSSIQNGSPNGGSGIQYFVGEFDGKRFRLDQEFAPFIRRRDTIEKAVWLDYGRDYHAAASWSNTEENNGRLLVTGCMNNSDYTTTLPTKGWQGTMAFPRVLKLRTTTKGPRIFQAFAEELISLRQTEVPININGSFRGNKALECDPNQLEIILEAGVAQDSNTVIGFQLSNNAGEVYKIGFNASENKYFSDRTKAGKNNFSEKFATTQHYAPKQVDGALVSMHLLIDATSCEFIADGGMTVMSEQFFPSQAFSEISLFVKGPSIDIQQLEVYELKGIWE